MDLSKLLLMMHEKEDLRIGVEFKHLSTNVVEPQKAMDDDREMRDARTQLSMVLFIFPLSKRP